MEEINVLFTIIMMTVIQRSVYYLPGAILRVLNELIVT